MQTCFMCYFEVYFVDLHKQTEREASESYKTFECSVSVLKLLPKVAEPKETTITTTKRVNKSTNKQNPHERKKSKV